MYVNPGSDFAEAERGCEIEIVQPNTPVGDVATKEVRIEGSVNCVAVLKFETERPKGSAIEPIEFPRENRYTFVLLDKRPRGFLPDGVKDLLLYGENAARCLEMPGFRCFVTEEDFSAARSTFCSY